MTNIAHVQLRDITFGNVRQIIDLQVSESQRRYVAPNATSIAEGLLNPGGWMRALFVGSVPVGFLLLLDPNVPGAIARSPIDQSSVMLWRFMIAHEHQRRGLGMQALDLACGQSRKTGATSLLTSYVPGDDGPELFYLRYGFTRTGAYRANGTEPELRLTL
ncbi:MAG: GNAT family N-acetyltransferase [Hyphomicrobiaceae bacterium]